MTSPKRTATNLVTLSCNPTVTSSAKRLVAPITFVGRTALSVETNTNVSTSNSSAVVASRYVPNTLFWAEFREQLTQADSILNRPDFGREANAWELFANLSFHEEQSRFRVLLYFIRSADDADEYQGSAGSALCRNQFRGADPPGHVAGRCGVVGPRILNPDGPLARLLLVNVKGRPGFEFRNTRATA